MLLVAAGRQVPGVGDVQLIPVPSQVLSQQTPWAHTPLAHSSVVPQVVPGVFLVWQVVPSQ